MKRFLSLLLVLVMVLGMLPVTVFADVGKFTDPAMDYIDVTDPDNLGRAVTDGNGHYVDTFAYAAKQQGYIWLEKIALDSAIAWSTDGSTVPMDTVDKVEGTRYANKKWLSYENDGHTLGKYDGEYVWVILDFVKLYDIKNQCYVEPTTSSQFTLDPDNDGLSGGEVVPVGMYTQEYYYDVWTDLYLEAYVPMWVGFPSGSENMTVTMDGQTLKPRSEAWTESLGSHTPGMYWVMGGGTAGSSTQTTYPCIARSLFVNSPVHYVYDVKPVINSVTVNGESVADCATYISNSEKVTVKTTYDSVLSQALQDYGCSVKQLSAYYLNGEKINVAALTPVSNGDGTSTKTYSRNLTAGDTLKVESWLEVTWPDGSKDRVDEHTASVTYKKQYIDYVDIVDIDLPEAGARPDMEYDIISANLDEKKTKIEWFECDKNGRYDSTKPLSATDLYKEDTYYRVNVTVYPREGYVFDSRNLMAYINDPSVEYYFANDGLVLFDYYSVHEVDTKNTIDVFLNSKDFVTIKDGDYLAQSSDTPTTAKPTNNYIYYKDGVLYLNNYERNVHLRFSEKHLEVVFSGDNAIRGFESNYNDYDYTAIAFYGGADDYLDLNGMGRSSCTITAYAAFFNGGNYVLDDGTYVAFWWTDYVEVNGGADIKLHLSQYGPFSEADVTLCVNEGAVEFADLGTWQSDWLLTDLAITGGTAYVRGSYKDEYALWDQVSDFNDYDYLLVKNPETTPPAGALLGDVNLDGQVNSIDSNLLKRSVAGEYQIDEASPAAVNADINGDGQINSIDSNLLKRMVAGEYKP